MVCKHIKITGSLIIVLATVAYMGGKGRSLWAACNLLGEGVSGGWGG